MAFSTWFAEQHGSRELEFTDTDDDELRTKVALGRAAKAELRRREQWDKRWTSALWAWQARDKQ